MEVCFSVGVHIKRLLTFQSAFRDVPSSQNMSASFTNVHVCSVGAVSNVTSKLVELLGEMQKAEAKATATQEDSENSESLTDCANRVELLRKVQKAEAKSHNYTCRSATKNSLIESDYIHVHVS